MMSNLDKDIKVIKDICYDNTGEKMFYIDISSNECEEFIQAVENVLKELNKKDGKIALLNLAEISLETQNEDLKAELETYKKIVADIEKYIKSIKDVTVKIVNKPKFDYKDELIWEMDDKKSGVYIELELDKIEKILKLKEVKKDEI